MTIILLIWAYFNNSRYNDIDKVQLISPPVFQIDAAGLTEEVEAALPHLRHNIVPNRSKIAEDLEKLAKQQEILAAEMKKYLAEDQVGDYCSCSI